MNEDYYVPLQVRKSTKVEIFKRKGNKTVNDLIKELLKKK